MDVREKTSNEKRLIDANALMSYMDECSKESRFRVYYGYAKSFINAAPTVDAVEVVRCRECKYHKEEGIGMVYCPNMIGGWVENEWFCANGKRKEGAD